LASIEGLTLLISFLTLLVTAGLALFFGFHPYPAVRPPRNRDFAYIEDKPAVRVLHSTMSGDASGSTRLHLTVDSPNALKQGDILTFRGLLCAVVEVDPAIGDNDPTHFVALCKIVGGASQ